MLKIEIIAVGTKPPSWISEGIEQYASRMKRDCRFDISEVKTSERKRNQSIASHRDEEARLIDGAIAKGARVIAMDSSGKNWSTGELAEKLDKWSHQTSHFQFLIGGPDGLARSCLARADDVWSLSRLTFPHFLVRVLLSEQIYRALMVNANHPYHK